MAKVVWGLGSRQDSQTGRDRQREADRWIRSRGERSRQTDRGWAAGKIVRQAGIGNWQDRKKYQDASRGKALRNSGENLAGNAWEERTNIGSTHVEVVGLIREGQSGRQVNVKTRDGS